MALWNKTLEQMKLNLSKPSYDTWLKNTTLLPFDKDDDKLVIEAPNMFSRDWIQGRYTNLISDTIYNITGKHYNLEFITNPEGCVTDEGQHLPLIKAATENATENKLDLIMSELKEMRQRISNLETKIQDIKAK